MKNNANDKEKDDDDEDDIQIGPTIFVVIVLMPFWLYHALRMEDGFCNPLVAIYLSEFK